MQPISFGYFITRFRPICLATTGDCTLEAVSDSKLSWQEKQRHSLPASGMIVESEQSALET